MTSETDVQDLGRAFRDGLLEALGAKLYGLYLYGAVAFPESGATGDVGFHAILAAPPDRDERAAIERLHARLAREYLPLGGELDGYYILLLYPQPVPAHVQLPDPGRRHLQGGCRGLGLGPVSPLAASHRGGPEVLRPAGHRPRPGAHACGSR
jgi:hypothetical protein